MQSVQFMKAVVQTQFGSPEVLTVQTVPVPAIGPRDARVRVLASPVTSGDRRLRSADFPGISMVPGRLLMGITRPRHATPGTMFAGRVEAIGAEVTRFAVGDDVFGSCDGGAHAEYLSVPEGGPIAAMPEGMDHAEAAAVPYGAVTALMVLRDAGGVAPGERVLIVGAAGEVGRFAVQMARHLGARVTAVCAVGDFDLVRSLGAEEVIDYRAEDFTESDRRWDVVFDTADATRYGRCKRVLSEGGRFLSIHLTVRTLLAVLATSLFGRRKAKLVFAMGGAEGMAAVRALLVSGALRPVVGRRLPLGRIAEAHETRGVPRGSAVVTMAEAVALRRAA